MNRRLFLAFIIFFFCAYVYLAAVRPLLAPFISLPGLPPNLSIAGATVLFFLFSLSHAAALLGWRQAALFLVITAVVSWGIEQLGVTTGMIFGNYHYTGVLGPKLGDVPVLIPITWFAMAYPSYVLSNCLLSEEPAGTPRALGSLLWLSLVSAVVVTGKDLLVDPRLSGPAIHAWVWQQDGAYFGVPLRNFAGWLFTSFVVFGLYRLLESRMQTRPLTAITKWFVTLPLIAHAVVLVGDTTGVFAALSIIGPFVVGVPWMLALGRIWFRLPGSELSWS